ncbi:hypothetical protein R6Q57_002339 [Mikania cordata]
MLLPVSIAYAPVQSLAVSNGSPGPPEKPWAPPTNTGLSRNTISRPRCRFLSTTSTPADGSGAWITLAWTQPSGLQARMQIWDPRHDAGKCVAKVHFGSPVCCVEFSPFGGAVAKLDHNLSRDELIFLFSRGEIKVFTKIYATY